MLSDHRDKIDTLLLKRLSGDLSSSETAVLEQMLKCDDEVKALWHTLQQRINTPDAQEFRRSLDLDGDWQQLSGIIGKKERRAKNFMLKCGLLVTTILAGIVCSSTLLIQKINSRPPASKPVHHPPPQHTKPPISHGGAGK